MRPVLSRLPALCVPRYSHRVYVWAPGHSCWYKEQYNWARIVFFDGWIMLAWIVNLLSYGFALRYALINVPGPP